MTFSVLIGCYRRPSPVFGNVLSHLTLQGNSARQLSNRRDDSVWTRLLNRPSIRRSAAIYTHWPTLVCITLPVCQLYNLFKLIHHKTCHALPNSFSRVNVLSQVFVYICLLFEQIFLLSLQYDFLFLCVILNSRNRRMNFVFHNLQNSILCTTKHTKLKQLG